MKTMTLEEFHAACLTQGVSTEDIALRCPMCQTVQSGRDFIGAGAGENFDAVEHFLGFACIGRFTGAPSPRGKPDGEPCNWTLGGLFKTHRLEVVTPDGVRHPRFELASPDEAKAHAARPRRAP